MNALPTSVAVGECGHDHQIMPGSSIHVGLVRLWGRDLAIPAKFVREVVPLPEHLQPAFAKADGLAGSIIVRGQVVPVVDISRMLGFDDAEHGPGIVVVLRHDRHLVGLFVHAVSGLTSVPVDTIQPYVFNGGCNTPLVASTFALEGRLVGLIDTGAIMNLPGIPRAREMEHNGGRSDLSVAQRRLLVLSVAGAELALEATVVVATVPATQLRLAPAVSDQWAGVIDFRGWEVPVIDDISLLGLSGHAANIPSALIIIVRLGDDQLLGIKADRVHRILSVREQDIRSLPPAISDKLPLFSGSIGNGDGGQSLLLSFEALSNDRALRMIAKLTQRRKAAATADPTQVASRTAVAQPYLIFRNGERRLACALADITQIVKLPGGSNRLSCPDSPLCGFISHAGEAVALIDLGVANRDAPGDVARMVLIVTDAGSTTGFIVDYLETVVRVVAQDMPVQLQKSEGSSASFIRALIGATEHSVGVCCLKNQVQRSAPALTHRDGRVQHADW